MTFAILIQDYNLFYTRYLENNSSLSKVGYQEKIKNLLNTKYYQADSLAQGLTKSGHQAEVIIPECNPLQLSWTKENCKKLYYKWHLQKPSRSFKARFFNDYNTFNSVREEILLEQIKKIKPDIVFVYAGFWMERKTIRKIKKISKKIILHWSSPVEAKWKEFPFNEFDFIVSSSQAIVDYFLKRKINSYYLQQAFDDEVLNNLLEPVTVKKDLVFIGNFSIYHSYRFEIIEYLLQNNINIDIYGSGKESMPANSLIKKKIKPALNGVEMFEKYREFKLALHIYGQSLKNDEIDLSAFAGAKRNFEITGAGTALLTSYQDNLKELFDENEIITFKTKEECLEKINYYLAKPDELNKIAKAGQQKTLSQHTFNNRAETLLKLTGL